MSLQDTLRSRHYSKPLETRTGSFEKTTFRMETLAFLALPFLAQKICAKNEVYLTRTSFMMRPDTFQS